MQQSQGSFIAKLNFVARAWAGVRTSAVLLTLILTVATGSVLAGARASDLRSEVHAEKDHSTRLKLLSDVESLDSAEANTLTKDSDREIRKAAAVALARQRSDNSAVPELRRLANNDQDDAVRSTAILGLGSHQSDFDFLKSTLENTNDTLMARESAASAISLFRSQDAVDELLAIYNSADGELKDHVKVCLQSMANAFPDAINSVIGVSHE